MSVTEALRAGAPWAFGALYDEHAVALYAYCHVLLGDEAGDALRDAFVTLARDPGGVPDDDAELPVWLHSVARAECVRRGALLRGIAASRSGDPVRRALTLLSPEHREVLALSNALNLEDTAQVLGVERATAETLVREAQRNLEQAIAAVGGREPQDSPMLAALSGESLQRLVTLGYEPPAQQREWVLSSCAAVHGPGGRAAFDTDGTPLPVDAFSAQADDATHRLPRISPYEPATEPLHRVDGTSADVRPERPSLGESPPTEPAQPPPGLTERRLAEYGIAEPEIDDHGLPGRVPAGLGAGSADGWTANTGEQPPPVHGTHAKRREPFPIRRSLVAVGLVACAAAATGTVLAWPDSHNANRTGTAVRQSAEPSRPAQPTPPDGQASSPPKATTSAATPTRTTAPPTPTAPSTSTAPAEGPASAHRTPPHNPTPTAHRNPSPEPAPPAIRTPPARPKHPAKPTRPAEPPMPTMPPDLPPPRPKPDHTTAPDHTAVPGRTTAPDHTAVPGHVPADGHRTIGRRLHRHRTT